MYTIDKQIQQKVTACLGWTEQQYSQFIYDCGLAYLNYLTGSYPAVFSEITKSADYWIWWNQHWETREKEFIECTESVINYTEFEPVYKHLHDPAILITAQYLNGRVLEESYKTLVTTITKNQRNATA